MATVRVLQAGEVSVLDYRCTCGPGDKPFVEVFPSHSISYVRAGAFGCRSRGRSFELVAGSLLIGAPGEEYLCTHAHHRGGDECLSFQYRPETIEQVAPKANWHAGALPAVAELAVVGEWAQAVCDVRSDMALDELGLILAARFARLAGEPTRFSKSTPRRDRKRAIEAALWIEEHASRSIDLARVARWVGLSSFYFLRLFTNVIGVSPHQYLVRTRVRTAARLLIESDLQITEIALRVGFNDISNFVRTFKRAAGASPREFRKTARENRKILQERFASLS